VSDKAISLLDGVWAYDNPQAEIDYAYRALHVVSLAEKAIARKFYGAKENKATSSAAQRRAPGDPRGATLPLGLRRHPRDGAGDQPVRCVSDIPVRLSTVTDADGKPLFKLEDLQMLHDARRTV